MTGTYCKENCPEDEKEKNLPDADGCYDKGEQGVWCPKQGTKGHGWYCKEKCPKEQAYSLA